MNGAKAEIDLRRQVAVGPQRVAPTAFVTRVRVNTGVAAPQSRVAPRWVCRAAPTSAPDLHELAVPFLGQQQVKPNLWLYITDDPAM